MTTFKSLISIIAILLCVEHANANQTASTEKQNEKKSVNITASTLNIQGMMLLADFQVSEKATLGPILGFNPGGIALGASVNYMFSSPVYQDGWSVNAQVIASKLGTSIGTLLQDNWFWENGFNMNAGVGLEYVHLDLFGNNSMKISGIVPKFGLNLGYIF